MVVERITMSLIRSIRSLNPLAARSNLRLEMLVNAVNNGLNALFQPHLVCHPNLIPDWLEDFSENLFAILKGRIEASLVHDACKCGDIIASLGTFRFLVPDLNCIAARRLQAENAQTHGFFSLWRSEEFHQIDGGVGLFGAIVDCVAIGKGQTSLAAITRHRQIDKVPLKVVLADVVGLFFFFYAFFPFLSK